MFNTDGVCIFKSSKFNVWPVYLVVNELPYSMRFRKENVVLAGLWFGDEKPVPNLFLEPLFESVDELRNGIEVQPPSSQNPFIVKGIIICCTCDLPAKALFYNMLQYNGKFGCQKCKHKGEYLQPEHIRVYPVERLRLRSDDETLTHAEQAFEYGLPVCGVKGPTILSLIIYQAIRAIAVDPMHCVFEGVVKALLKLWFSAKFLNEVWTISHQMKTIDERLTKLTPPSFVQRLPRSISSHLAFWKAHELKAWLFYYSIPCLFGILGERYFDHHLLLVLGISLLSQSDISAGDVKTATLAINEYVQCFEGLYGKRHMSNNLHQLLHLPETVRQFGPLWTVSCFPFEDLNGRLKRLVHGSNSAQLQIYSGVSKFLNLATLRNNFLVAGRPAHEFCENLDSKKGRMKRHLIASSVYIVGKCTAMHPLRPDIHAVCQRSNINGQRLFHYRRLLKEKVLYSSTEYTRGTRTNSTFAAYCANDGTSKIGQIRCFIRTTDCRCNGLCYYLARNYAIVQPCILEQKFTPSIPDSVLSTVHSLEGFENVDEAVDISSLKFVCFYCEINDIANSYLIEPVNGIEFE